MALLRNDSKFLDGKKIASENFVLDNINTHNNNKENPHGVTKSHVGLSNVSNVLQASKEEFDSHINSSLHVSLSDRENWNNKQGSITAGENITIFGNTISATNTTYDIADLLHDGLMSKEDKNKLVRSSNALDYMHLEEGDYFNLDTLTSFIVKESEQHIPLVNTSTQGLMSGSDKIKLDGIENGAQKNPTISTQSQAETGTDNTTMLTPLRAKQAIEKLAPTPPLASTSANGLMASTDKSKLDGIATGAQVNPSIASQVEALTGTNNTNMMTPLRTKEAILESATIVVNHGTNSSMARPYGASVVYWIGTVEPINATNNDLWVGGL